MSNETGQPAAPEQPPQQAKAQPRFALGCGLLMGLIFAGLYIFSAVNPDAFAPVPDLGQVYSQGYMFGQGEATVSLKKGIMSKYPFDRSVIRSFADKKSQQLTKPFPNEEARQKWVEGFITGYADKYDNYWNTGSL